MYCPKYCKIQVNGFFHKHLKVLKRPIQTSHQAEAHLKNRLSNSMIYHIFKILNI